VCIHFALKKRNCQEDAPSAACLFLVAKRNEKHANPCRLAVTLNGPLFNVELDDGSGRQRATTVLPIPQNVLAISMRLR
jgi:hypothetical protein